jgi:hypothetical protein
MSFSNTLGNSAMRALRGPTLPMMGRTLGVVLSAGALGASYQLAHEEGRGFINGMRQRAMLRHGRNEALTLLFTGSELPLELQTELLKARDIHKATVNMLLDPALTAPHHDILHMALVRLRGLQVVEDE